jgi:hypothetical protein
VEFRVLTLGALALSIGLSACAGDDTPSETGVEAGPAYVVATRVWSDDGAAVTSYFNVVSSLDAETTVDTDRGLEVAGAAKLYAVEGIGWFAVGGGEDPTITRYTLSEEGSLVEGDKLSLLDYGVQGLWDTLYVVSETKMYYPDRAGGRLIVLNPKEMTVDGVISLPETQREGFLSLYGYTPVIRDDKLLFTVGWFDWEENDEILGETGLVVLNTEDDSVERFDVDTRCGGISTGVITDSGDAYFVSSALAGAAHRLGRLTTAPCALRVEADADAFDADFGMNLADLTASDVSGEPIPAGGDSLFLRVFDESLATVTDENLTWELTGQSAWRWMRWDVESGETSLLEDLAPSTSDVVWFKVDDRVYGTETTEDYSHTTLIDLTAEDGPTQQLTAPGFMHGVARVR